MSRKPLLSGSAVVAILLGYLLLWPVGIDPVAWTPPPDPGLPAQCQGNAGLAAATLLAAELDGPEAIAIDAQGRLLTGTRDGRIVRTDGEQLATLANTGGRPLGMKLTPDGATLVVADGRKGLLSLTLGDGGASPSQRVLATAQGGVPFGFTDDVELMRDGTIVFTDASSRFGDGEWKLDLLEHGPHGRLLALRPGAADPELLKGGLHFANGVAAGPDGESVVVCEMGSYRLHRVFVSGAHAGQSSVFVENLPGFCDNVTWSPERRAYWVALGSPRNPLVDAMGPHPWLRKLTLRLPTALQPKPARHAVALAYDDTGALVDCRQHEAPDAYSPVASVIERAGVLYLGSFMLKGIAKVAIDPPPAAPPAGAAE